MVYNLLTAYPQTAYPQTAYLVHNRNIFKRKPNISKQQTFVSPSNVECQERTRIGDGFCQDYNNNRHCSFDGGDCCGPCVNREFCTECKCKTGDTDKITNARVGNGFCNDETNFEGCNFDGGDCCGTCVNSSTVLNVSALE